MNLLLSYPALNGEVVTEAHATVCAEKGHATYKNGDKVEGWCPRCGEVTAPKVKSAAADLVEWTKLREADLSGARKAFTMVRMVNTKAERMFWLKIANRYLSCVRSCNKGIALIVEELSLCAEHHYVKDCVHTPPF